MLKGEAMKRCIFCLNECPDTAEVCPSCGFDGSEANKFKYSLPLGTRLNKRYIVGGAYSKTGSFLCYHAFDCQARRRVKLCEYLPEKLMYRLPEELIIKYHNEKCSMIGDREISAFYSHFTKLCTASENSVLEFTDCFAENSTFCYVSAAESGTPLSSVIGNGRTLPFSKSVSLLMPVIDCAVKLEKVGKWHGCLSPYSIITEGGKIKSVTGYSYPPLSFNSPFDAPEKKLGAKSCGSFTDVYAIGAMLYEAVTGFIPPSAAERERGRTLRYPQSIDEKEKRIIEKAMALSPDQRYGGAGEFFADLTGKTPADGKKKQPASEIVRRSVLALASVCLAVSVMILINYYVIEPFKEQKQASDLASLVGQTGSEQDDPWGEIKEKHPDIAFPDGMNPSFAELYAINSDFAGWISIPELNINYSVVKGTDNDTYLRRDIYGKKTSYGVPFFDFKNSLRELDRNTIIYGHNMRHDDKIFGTLEQYKTVDGFKKAPLIGMSTLYGDYTFKVYAVFISNSKKSDDNGHIFNYVFTEAGNERFRNYINEIDKRKLYSTGVDINENDKILTLSTCCYDFEDARLVVVGRLLREGENPEVNVSLAQTNPNPKFPQAYYDAKKLDNPYKDDPDLFF